MKAIALFSGGLDSTLAMKLIIDQGIEVIACNINTGFCSTKDRLTHMKHMCDQVGAEFRSIDIQDEYIEQILFTPKYGYGKNFNPCIDCKILMLRRAKEMMAGLDASFLVTGEVLGQRPMSQRRDTLNVIERDSGNRAILLRPLSASGADGVWNWSLS